MLRYLKVVFACLLLTASGCLWDDPDLRESRIRLEGGRQQLPEASREAWTRADSVFNPLVKANEDLGFRPQLLVIGGAKLSLFHEGTTALYISEGVIHRCKSDSELAAVFASELSKMAIEDDARRGGAIVSAPDRPFTPRVTGGNHDLRGDADMTGLATQGYWEKETPRRNTQGGERDPNVLARTWLQKAGHAPNDLAKVGSLVRQAEANPEYENRLRKPANSGENPN